MELFNTAYTNAEKLHGSMWSGCLSVLNTNPPLLMFCNEEYVTGWPPAYCKSIPLSADVKGHLVTWCSGRGPAALLRALGSKPSLGPVWLWLWANRPVSFFTCKAASTVARAKHLQLNWTLSTGLPKRFKPTTRWVCTWHPFSMYLLTRVVLGKEHL